MSATGCPSAGMATSAWLLGAGTRPAGAAPGQEVPFDPLRLCIFTTIAMLAWILTPTLVVVWLGHPRPDRTPQGYRAGLTWSRCHPRDVRLLPAYLGCLGGLGRLRRPSGWGAARLKRHPMSA